MIGPAELTPSARYANTSEEKGKEFDRRADFSENSPRNYLRRLVRSSLLYKTNASIRASVSNYAFDSSLTFALIRARRLILCFEQTRVQISTCESLDCRFLRSYGNLDGAKVPCICKILAIKYYVQ